MNDKSFSNNIEDLDFTLNSVENDYENLIIRLEEISKTISILVKTLMR